MFPDSPASSDARRCARRAPHAALGLVVALGLALVATPALSRPPPLVAGDPLSPFDAILPFAPPLPLAGLALHWPGGPMCAIGGKTYACGALGTFTSKVNDGAGTAAFSFVDPDPAITQSGDYHRGLVMDFGPANRGQEAFAPLAAFDGFFASPSATSRLTAPGLTLAFWYRWPYAAAPGSPAHIAGWNPLVWVGGEGAARELLVILDHGVPTLVSDDGHVFAHQDSLGANVQGLGQEVVDDGRWHHIAFAVQTLCTRAASGAITPRDCLSEHGAGAEASAIARIFIDGTLRAENDLLVATTFTRVGIGPYTPPDSGFGASQPNRFGNASNGDYQLAPYGQIDDLFVYQRALGHDEIQHLVDHVASGVRFVSAAATGNDAVAIARAQDSYVQPAAPLQTALRGATSGPLALLDPPGSDGPFPAGAFTLLGWAQVPDGDGGSIDLRFDRAAASSVLSLRAASAGRLGLGCATGVAPGAAIDHPAFVASGSGVDFQSPWRFFAATSANGIASLLVDGVPARDPFAVLVPGVRCPVPPTPTQEALAFAALGTLPLAVAPLMLADHVLDRSTVLALGSPGPAVWIVPDDTPQRRPAELVGRLLPTWDMPYGSRADFVGGRNWGPSAPGATPFRPFAVAVPAEGALASIPSENRQVLPGVGEAAPFTFTIRFALNATRDVTGYRTILLARREGTVNGVFARDVVIGMRIGPTGGRELDMMLPDRDAAGTRFAYFGVPVDVPFASGFHTLSVSWRPGWTRVDAAGLVSVEPRVAVDGETITAHGDSNGEGPGIFALDPGTPGLLFEAPGARPSLTATRWVLGLAPGSPRDVALVANELRLYGREIDDVSDIAAACTPDHCGNRVCHGVDALDDAHVGSATCADCQPGYYALAVDQAGFAPECDPERAFWDPCVADVQCASHLCGEAGACLQTQPTTPTLLAAATQRCEDLGRFLDIDDDNDLFCGGCKASYATVPRSGSGAHDPDYACAWSPTLAPGAPCADDAACTTGYCAQHASDLYGVGVNLARGVAQCTDGIDCGVSHPSASATYGWEFLGDGAVTTPARFAVSRACAYPSHDACDARGESSERVVHAPGFRTAPATAYVCGGGEGECLPSHHAGWTVMSPQACALMTQRAFAVDGPRTAQEACDQFDPLYGFCQYNEDRVPRWSYTSWKNTFLFGDTAANRGELLDALWRGLVDDSPPAQYSPYDYSTLEAHGAGPLLLSYISASDVQRAALEQRYGARFLPLAACGDNASYNGVAGGVQFASGARNAFHNAAVNSRECMPTRQDDGAACPAETAPVQSSVEGAAYCKSRYCGRDTARCEPGGSELRAVRGQAGNDHNSGDSVSFGIIKCNATTLDVLAPCKRTANVCGDGIDNDHDGYTDGADADCWATREVDDGVTRTLRESLADPGACSNGRDDDGDGKSDGADPDCDPERALFAGEQPDCNAGAAGNDGDWRYAADLSETYSTCLFGTLFPPVPLYETRMAIDHQHGAACGSSSLKAKILGITVNAPPKPLAQCTGLSLTDDACAAAGGDQLLSQSSGCTVATPEELFVGNLLNPPTAAVCIPLPEDVEEELTYEFSLTKFGVPIIGEIGLKLNACIDAHIGISGDTDGYGLPKVEVTPKLGVGAQAAVGIGEKEKGMPVQAWVGVRLVLTIVEVSFPIAWGMRLDLGCYDDGITDGPATVACTTPNDGLVGKKKLVLQGKVTQSVNIVTTVLSGAMELFAELTIGPFTFSKTVQLFAWVGFVFTHNLDSRDLVSFKLDYEFTPDTNLVPGTSGSRTCDKECK